MSSLTLNRYVFHGTYAKPVAYGFARAPIGGIEQDRFRGHWITFGERVVHEFGPSLAMTLGGEASFHADVKQSVRDASGVLLDTSNPFRVLAAYAIN
ncbi:MAG TPA: hypothetical protein VIV60_03775 [Polyangiaceae bacterium]